MKGKNEMTASFPSLSQNEALARSVVAVFVSQLNPTVSELSDLRTAVSEAVTNAIVHGYRGTVGTVYITVRQVEEYVIQVKVRDKGVGIADIEKAMEPLYTTTPEEERAGLGFAVMQSFCDEVKVRSRPGSGTTVTLIKKLQPHVPASPAGKGA